MTSPFGRGVRTLSLLALLGSIACRSPTEEEGTGIPGQCLTEAPSLSPQKTDILFVIDNSNSMTEEQDGVATELPAFVQALRAGGGLTQDFRVGVVTTSVYLYAESASGPPTLETASYAQEAGHLQPVPDADGTVPANAPRFLEGDDPQLVERFRALVKRGVVGSGQETAFEAALLAVTPPLIGTPTTSGGNGGFLRDEARLLVVIVTDEDDCSERARPPQVVIGADKSHDYCADQADKLTPVSDYVNAFRALTDSTGAPRTVLWASIAPVATTDKRTEPVVVDGVLHTVDCPTSYGPGARHRQMAAAFDPSLRNLDSICRADGQGRADYHGSLINIAGIANENQSLEVSNLPDPSLLQVALTRGDGTVQMCTTANGGITWVEPSVAGQKGRIQFDLESCPRRYDDQKVELKLLCAT